MSLLDARGLCREFAIGAGAVTALAEVTLAADAGEFLVVTGPSGSGKSTLLNLLSGLDRPSRGEVCFDGTSLSGLSDGEMAALRNRAFGFMFQTPHVLVYKTVSENVALPSQYTPAAERGDVPARAAGLLSYVGLEDLAARYPNTLSAGELQRLVFARALINGPRVIFADEPTGSLDADNSHRLLQLLRRQAQAGKCVVMATHDAGAMRYATRRLDLDKFEHVRGR